MISLFAWNTRGFNEKRKHLSFRSWIQSAAPSFGCLIETRVQESKCDGIITSTLPGWKYLNNYDHHRLGKTGLYGLTMSMLPFFTKLLRSLRSG